MMKHNGKGRYLPLETECGREAHSALFRLGLYCLIALLFTALLLVGGSFSRNTSAGTVSVSEFTLNTAGFDGIKVEKSSEYTSGGIYEGTQTVLYAFKVTNNSDVDITYDMDFTANISLTAGNKANTKTLQFILIDTKNGSNIYLNPDGIVVEDEFETEFRYSTKESGGAFFLSREDEDNEATVILIVDYIKGYANDKIKLTISGTIAITEINQAKEGTE